MLTVIGCGNPNRGDDGVGSLVARRLMERVQGRPCHAVRVFDLGTAGMDVMFRARGSSALVLIDASRTGSEPGTVFEVPGSELEDTPPESLTLHDFRWDHALYAGRRIYGDDFPSDVTVFLIEAQSLDFGLELSAPVGAAAERVIARIAARMEAYAATAVP